MPDETPKTPDFSGLRVRTMEQAKADLPQPAYMAPGEGLASEIVPSKLNQAYEHAKQFLSTHEANLSDKVLKPFRQGLDNMADELQQAGESGHTQSGGALTGPTRALAEGVGAFLRQVPVGKDVKDTAMLAATSLPELAEEGELERLPKQSKSIPPERSAMEFDTHIKKGGAIPGGIQSGDPEIGLTDLVLFHDPVTGSTLALPKEKVTAGTVKQQLTKSRQMYLDAEDRAVKKVANNASGESAASQEALNRAASEKQKGESYFRVDSRSKKETPLSSIDGVDAKPGPYEHIVKRTSKGDSVMDSGEKAGPLPAQKPAPITEKAPAKPSAKAQEMNQKVSKLAADYLTTLQKPKP